MIAPGPHHVRDVCRIGQGHRCCRYLIASGQGLHCAKLSPAAKATIDRMVPTMTAQSDNCEGVDPDEVLP